jgi:hypothetical protein
MLGLIGSGDDLPRGVGRCRTGYSPGFSTMMAPWACRDPAQRRRCDRGVDRCARIMLAFLVPFRASIAHTSAALVLVLLVVVAAATGVQAAGVAAALSGAVGFDFFLTQPYGHLKDHRAARRRGRRTPVDRRLAVNEVALWGRRQQDLASREDGYLNGVVRTAGLVAGGPPPPEILIAHVSDQMVEILQIDNCWFDSDVHDVAPAPLIRDGSVASRS